ncbi:GH92 family glycosyl hydrolase [Kribbella koreensis]|uniref:GH92 family glycosyl hydrolase n=1 Tax=Kribbella koreensis TaxID=57909 RepID=A0ABN1QZ61_9ACTN
MTHPVDDIDPLIGALTTLPDTACGKTFPGPVLPFGLVQLSPDTISGGDHGSGYSADMDTIEGFSFTHLGGIGCYGDLGNLQVMPQTGPLITDRVEANSPYSNQIVKAGYYSVDLDRYQVRTELTAKERAGIIRFTYAAAGPARIKVDLARRVGFDGSHSVEQSVELVDDHTVEGWMRCDRSGGGWICGNGPEYTVFFSLRLSQPIAAFATWDGDDIRHDAARTTASAAAGFFLELDVSGPVLLKAGISYTSVEGARRNLVHDLPGWDFDEVAADARAAWAAVLEKVEIEGGTAEQRQIFRTALYHTMIEPRRSSDVGDDLGYERRTVFSGWDVFRAQLPLMTIIDEKVVTDQINTLLDLTASGRVKGLARWELLGVDTDTMVGDPAINIISEAVVKGICGFDVDTAYRFCREVALGPVARSNRNDLENWLSLGYSVDIGLSTTLENSYSDHALARFASVLGLDDDVRLLDASAQNYRNLFNPEAGWFRGRNADGSWMGFDEGCTESNPDQQGWFVPHDVAGLISLAGGEIAFIERLNAIFENTPPADLMKWNDFYNHSNEPVHQMAFMFTYAGAPWLTQKWSRYVCDHGYGTGPEGLGGNEDCGQMSAWYIFAAAGLYPVSPVDKQYILGSPIFDRTTFRTSRNATFTITREGDGIYVAQARLNDHPTDRPWLTHEELIAGGNLHLTMSLTPTDWGTKHRPQAGDCHFPSGC